jgi:ubiquinone/menaquinone biosynthesis C-methylase UbiE
MEGELATDANLSPDHPDHPNHSDHLDLPRADSFGPVTPYYDELMKQVPYRMWVGYYLLLLSQQDAHPKRILDVCCGTGTMCEMLTDESYQMAGFDLSGGMIEEARRKARRKKLDIRYEVMDAAEADMGDTYDAAFSFFDSLNNIVRPDRLQAAFHRVAAHLPPGGSFIFDLNTAYAFEAKLFDQENLRANAKLKYKWVGDWNPETRIITVDMQFWYRGEAFHEVHTQRAYDEEEVREMLNNAGFTSIRAYHSYTLNPPRYSSDRLHYSALRV